MQWKQNSILIALREVGGLHPSTLGIPSASSRSLTGSKCVKPLDGKKTNTLEGDGK
jgi:hypothetical protein